MLCMPEQYTMVHPSPLLRSDGVELCLQSSCTWSKMNEKQIPFRQSLEMTVQTTTMMVMDSMNLQQAR